MFPTTNQNAAFFYITLTLDIILKWFGKNNRKFMPFAWNQWPTLDIFSILGKVKYKYNIRCFLNSII